MKVYGNTKTMVDIDPVEVIDGLLKSAAEDIGWVFERDGKYFESVTAYMGNNHPREEDVEISKEKHDYIVSLHTILRYLKR